MNANELIKKLERAKGIVYNEMGCDELIVLAIEESEKFLSRTRIRVTAEEKPTMEDADVDENVLAIDKAIDSHTFNIRIYQFVGRDPDRFPFWTSLPQLPEVTP